MFSTSSLYTESDVGAVVEGVVARCEGFGGFELSDVQGVVVALPGEAFLALGKRGTEEGVAVAGQDDLPGVEIEGEGLYMCHVHGEAVDDAVAVVLLLHGFQHTGDDGFAGGVVGEEVVPGLRAGRDDGGTSLGKFLLGGLRVL